MLRPRQAVIATTAFATLCATGVWVGLRRAEAPLAMPADSVDPADAPRAPAVRETAESDPEPVRTDATPPPWLGELIGAEIATEAAATVPVGTIHGRLAWKDSGVPVIGARVRLQRAPRDTVVPEPGEERLPPADDPDVAAVTNAWGEFTVPFPALRTAPFLRFELPDGTVEIEDVRSVPARGIRAWQGEYLLDPRGALVGAVITPDGAPVAGATVRAVDEERFDDPTIPWDVREARIAGAETVRLADDARTRLLPFPAAKSDRDGRFAFPAVRQGAVHLLVQHDDLASRRVDVPVIGGRTTDAGGIVLAEGSAFRVRLLDTELRPLSGVSVAVAPAGWRFGPPPGTTDENGVATVRLDVAPDDPHATNLIGTVGVRRTRTGSWVELGRAALPGATWVLSPCDEFEVLIATSDSARPDSVRFGTDPKTNGVRADRTGSGYRISGIPAESSPVLFAAAQGYAPAVVEVERLKPFPMQFLLDAAGDDLAAATDAAAAARAPVQMTLVRLFGARVRVVDEARRPVPGAVVTFRAAPSPRWADVPGTNWGMLDRDLRLGATDADGALDAEGLWDAAITFTASHPGFGRVHLRHAQLAPGELVELQLATPVHVTGVVRDTVQPHARRYRIRLDWPPPASIGIPWPPLETTYSAPLEIATNAEGHFDRAQVPPWPWRGADWILTVLEPRVPDAGEAFRTVTQRRPYLREEMRWAPGERPDLDLRLDARRLGTAIAGVVRLGGVPAVAAHVELWSEPRERWTSGPDGRVLGPRPTSLLGTATTDERGCFAFAGRMQDPHEVRVSVLRRSEFMQVASATLERDSRGRLRLPIAIDAGLGELTLLLRDATGAPLRNRPVSLRSDRGAELRSVADDHGTIVEHGLPEGTWQVLATDAAGGAVSFDPPVVIRAGHGTFDVRNATAR